jgi:hypothetical protein
MRHANLLVCGLLICGADADAADGDPRDLAEVVGRVRANEAKCKNIEIVLESKYRDERPDGGIGSGVIVTSSTRVRWIAQGDLYYFAKSTTCQDLGAELSPDGSIAAFDGRTARMMAGRFLVESDDGSSRLIGAPEVDETTAQIHENRTPTWILSPHTLNVGHDQDGRFPMSLSAFLAGGPGSRAFPGTYQNIHVRSTFEGMDEIDGLRCVKVCCRTWRDGSDPAKTGVDRRHWLAIERGFLPVRIEEFAVRAGRKHPDAITTLSGLKEIGPGVWCPSGAEVVAYDRELQDREQVVVKHRTTYKITKAALDPKYAIALFRNIPFPNGVTVHVIEDGKVVRDYVHKSKD